MVVREVGGRGGGGDGGHSGGGGGGAGQLFSGRSDAGSEEALTRGLFVMRRIFPMGPLWTPFYARPHLPRSGAATK